MIVRGEVAWICSNVALSKFLKISVLTVTSRWHCQRKPPCSVLGWLNGNRLRSIIRPARWTWNTSRSMSRHVSWNLARGLTMDFRYLTIFNLSLKKWSRIWVSWAIQSFWSTLADGLGLTRLCLAVHATARTYSQNSLRNFYRPIGFHHSIKLDFHLWFFIRIWSKSILH